MRSASLDREVLIGAGFVIVLTVALGAYVRTYYKQVQRFQMMGSLVEATYRIDFNDGNVLFGGTFFRLTHIPVDRFFAPMNWLDRKLRPAQWDPEAFSAAGATWE